LLKRVLQLLNVVSVLVKLLNELCRIHIWEEAYKQATIHSRPPIVEELRVLSSFWLFFYWWRRRNDPCLACGMLFLFTWI